MTDDFYAASEWKSSFKVLSPGSEWPKPSGIPLWITNVSFAVRPDSEEDFIGILIVRSWDGTFTLCKLFPHQPSQEMNVFWNAIQHIVFYNSGNREITISYSYKSQSD